MPVLEGCEAWRPFEVVAPTLVSMKAGDRVKTDGRVAERLAEGRELGSGAGICADTPAEECEMDNARAFGSGLRMALSLSWNIRQKVDKE